VARKELRGVPDILRSRVGRGVAVKVGVQVGRGVLVGVLVLVGVRVGVYVGCHVGVGANVAVHDFDDPGNLYYEVRP
jgi:hypothetical protein